MAGKNTTNASIAENETMVNENENTAAEKLVSNNNPDEEMVYVSLPKIPGEAPIKYVAVNGKAWNIPLGKRWKVPKYVADSIDRADNAQEEADEFSKEEQKKMTEIQGAPV